MYSTDIIWECYNVYINEGKYESNLYGHKQCGLKMVPSPKHTATAAEV